MECNKDEATRAKEIAETKFMAKDILGAKKFALKAQSLFPGLEGIPQMLETLNVYVAAEKKICGEADWYGILNVDPRADEETVRKQYRKLALMLHPDKNKSVGADGAFKLISEAWSLLSDKARRLRYDLKRNGKDHKRGLTPGGAPSRQSGANVFSSSKNSANSNTAQQKGAHQSGYPSGSASSAKPKSNTFWTVCQRCKMQYEYLRIYRNHNLLCPNCHEPFYAAETAPPPFNGSKPTPWNVSQPPQDSSHQTSRTFASNQGRGSQGNFPWGPFSRTAGAASVAQAASMVNEAYQRVKREREEAEAATKREEALRRKHSVSRKVGGASATGNSASAKRRRRTDGISRSSNGGKASSQGNVSGTQGNTDADMVSDSRDSSLREIEEFFMLCARKEIQRKLCEWKATTAVKEVKVNGKGNTSDQSLDTNCEASAGKSFCGASGNNRDAEALKTMSIDVPDPDFHDFDRDRLEWSFEENQVWAAYDDDDGMPRYYAMVRSVISVNPFKMQISWLNAKSNSEFNSVKWVGSGFSKTCGDFRAGKLEIYESLNSFSHKVRWTKGLRETICIYPRKGEVWALYRNWSPDWNELTADETRHKYDMVEVLEDYNEEFGVTVAPLVKVAGFRTVFHQHLDPREVRRIPREEMFRFSHLVPSHLLSGHEAPNAPKGCRELDPAATPLELLQVIGEVKGEETDDLKEGEVVEIPDVLGEDTVYKVENVSNLKEREVVYLTEEDPVGKVEQVDDEKHPGKLLKT